MLMHARNDLLNLDSMRFPLMVSEKLNGWRCMVTCNKMFTKSLGQFANRNLREHLADALAYSTTGRTGFALDGELWSPLMTLSEIQSVLQSTDAAIPAHLELYVFDVLTSTEIVLGRSARFERRAARIPELPVMRNVVPHSYHICESRPALMQSYSETLHGGGEGLVLRSPTGTYRIGRVRKSDRIIWKMKPETLPN